MRGSKGKMAIVTGATGGMGGIVADRLSEDEVQEPVVQAEARCAVI